jgi:hypothetical protein
MRALNFALLLPVLACAGCAHTLQPQDFSGKTPELLPLQFFAGHTHSWGIVETAGGEPEETFETDAIGAVDADGILHWPQHLTFSDGKDQERDWQFRQTGDHTYEGTANDVAGTAHAEAYGNLFHLTFTLERSPGDALKNVAMEEWMVREQDGSVVNRIIVTKLGLTAAMGTEYFRRLDK